MERNLDLKMVLSRLRPFRVACVLAAIAVFLAAFSPLSVLVTFLSLQASVLLAVGLATLQETRSTESQPRQLQILMSLSRDPEVSAAHAAIAEGLEQIAQQETRFTGGLHSSEFRRCPSSTHSSARRRSSFPRPRAGAWFTKNCFAAQACICIGPSPTSKARITGKMAPDSKARDSIWSCKAQASSVSSARQLSLTTFGRKHRCFRQSRCTSGWRNADSRTSLIQIPCLCCWPPGQTKSGPETLSNCWCADG